MTTSQVGGWVGGPSLLAGGAELGTIGALSMPNRAPLPAEEWMQPTDFKVSGSSRDDLVSGYLGE